MDENVAPLRKREAMNPADFQRAEQFFRKGQYPEAERQCRSLLANDPNSVDAWRLLGKICKHTGRREEAIECWRQTLQLKAEPEILMNLGQNLVEAGATEEAIQAFREALKLRPHWTEAESQLGMTLGAAGKPSEAIPFFNALVQKHPDSAAAHQNLGVALAQIGQSDLAQKAFLQALTLQPAYSEAHYSLGNLLAASGQRQEAIEHYRQALSHRPLYPEALNNLGLVLSELNRPEEAIPYLQQAVRIKTSFAQAYSNLAIALEALGRFEEAQSAINEALRIEPNKPDAHATKANICKAQGYLDEALSHYQYSLWLRPNEVSVRYNRSLTLLQKGAWEEGWKEYEWRLHRKVGEPRCNSKSPMWDGSPGNGRTILVWAEQGLGDVIQFCRFVPLLKTKGFRVVFHIPGILLRLMQTLKGVDELTLEGDVLPSHDVQCPLMSLPHHFQTTIHTVPAASSYLEVPSAFRSKWQQLELDPKKKSVGLYWQGNPNHPGDRHRSIPFTTLLPLVQDSEIEWISLQQGPGRDDASRSIGVGQVRDLGKSYQTIDDLAAVIAKLDLVISVDTAAAHLAGALGKTVWIGLSSSPDWRWLMQCTDTPWYKSAILLRQRKIGAWAELIEKLNCHLNI
jgi:tetratricopeptide (TPR) repeat protein